MSTIKLFLFGPPRLKRDGQSVTFNLKKGLALLAYLALAGQPQSRDTLATLLWPESSQREGRASLRRTLYRLNNALEAEIISSTPELAAISPDCELWIDVVAYQSALEQCNPATSTSLRSQCISTLETAINMYTDDFLAGFTLPDCPDFDDWQYFQREGLRQQQATTLEALAHHHVLQESWAEAITYGRSWVALDPLHEPAQRTLIELYAASGQQSAALRQYADFQRLLDEELGVEPEPETVTLAEAVRNGLPLPLQTIHAPPPVQYVQNDGVMIAYQVVGDGPVDLVVIWGFLNNIELGWEYPPYTRYILRMVSFSRLIQLDRRGVGLSERVGYPPTPEHVATDIAAVMHAIGSDRAVIMGYSEGGGVAATFAAMYPERTRGIIIYGAMAKGLRSADYPWVLHYDQYDQWLVTMTTNWGEPVNLKHFAPSAADDPEMQTWWRRHSRSSASPGTLRELISVLRDLDVRPILPSIRVPALVVHRAGDRAVRVGNGRYFAQHLPNSTYAELDGDDHLWFCGNADEIADTVEKFVRSLPVQHLPSHQMASILCLLSATPLSDELQEVINKYDGQIIVTDEPAVLVKCPGPTPALRCASSLRGPAIRGGIHFGEFSIQNGEPAGPALTIARQLAAAAPDGEVLISLAVKGLTASSGFGFDEIPDSARPQIGDSWPVYSLR